MSRRLNVLLSRFNWPHPAWEGKEDSEEYARWIDERIELFRTLTVPSVLNSVVRPDLWIILASSKARNIKGRIASTIDAIPHEIALHDGNNMVDAVRTVLSRYEFPLCLQTTRLDTDDLIAPTYFETLNNEANAQKIAQTERLFVTYSGGAIYSKQNDQFYYWTYPANPFLTYAEHVASPEKIVTVFNKPHNELCTLDDKVLSIRSHRPMWASVIHDGNLSNRTLGGWCKTRIDDTDVLKSWFGIGAAA